MCPQVKLSPHLSAEADFSHTGTESACADRELMLFLSLSAWLPAPALFGTVIDQSCIWWKHVCGKKFSCGYYDNIILRNRYECLSQYSCRIDLVYKYITFLSFVFPLQVLGFTGGLQDYWHPPAGGTWVEGAADPRVQLGKES